MKLFTLFALSFAAAFALGCSDPDPQGTSGDPGAGGAGTGGTGGGTGGGAGGAGGGSGGGSAGDSTLLYLGTLDNYPMAIDAKKDVVAVLIETVSKSENARLSFLPIMGGALEVQGTAPIGFPATAPIVTDGEHIACALSSGSDAATLVVTSPGGGSTTLFDFSDPHRVDRILGIHAGRIVYVGEGLKAIPVEGGPIETIAADFKVPAVASETNAFGFTAQNTLVAVPLDGGAPEDLGDIGASPINDLAASGGDVYFLVNTAEAEKKEVLTISAGGGVLRSVAIGPFVLIAADGGDVFAGQYTKDGSDVAVFESATGTMKKTIAMPAMFQSFERIVAPSGSPYVVTLVNVVEQIEGQGFSPRNEILRLSK